MINDEDSMNTTRIIDQQDAMYSAYLRRDNLCNALDERISMVSISVHNRSDDLSINSSDTLYEYSNSMLDGSVGQWQESLALESSIDAYWPWLVKRLELIKEEREFIEQGTDFIEIVNPNRSLSGKTCVFYGPEVRQIEVS